MVLVLPPGLWNPVTMPRPPTNPRDVALGLVVTGARFGAATGKLLLLPVRVAARTPVMGSALRRAGEELSSDGHEARELGRRRLEDAAGGILAAPEVERTIDHAMSGPLTEAVARSIAEHRVAERMTAELVATPEFEEAVAAALDHEATRRLVDRALASPGLEQLVADAIESRLATAVTERLLQSPEFQRIVGDVASSPEVRMALTRQTTSLAEEMVAGARRRATAADESLERRARGWLRRPQRVAAAYRDGLPPYGGVATRALALALDTALALALAVAVGATLALIASLVGELRPAWLVGVLAAGWWLLVSGSYFVLFWTAAGQTPAMRLMRLQVLDRDGGSPSLWRSLVRFAGLLLAIVPLFAGFLPVLFDERRRGLPDYLAGTVVHDVDRMPVKPAPERAYEPAPTG
jgi:uncharacterized RDD family membrane protein YckC